MLKHVSLRIFLTYQVEIPKLYNYLSNIKPENDNLRGEYAELFNDVEEEIMWARIALERSPDAINMWIGNGKSTTTLHKDNYENVYCQIIGEKHFVLLPPIESPCVNEKIIPLATYVVLLKNILPSLL